jgi:hypothetical protein
MKQKIGIVGILKLVAAMLPVIVAAVSQVVEAYNSHKAAE